MITDLFNSFDNLNIFLKRNVDCHPYQRYGRKETLEEAEEVDRKILHYLDKANLPYSVVEVAECTVDEIFNLVKLKLKVS
jgi:hypothetical protein